MSPSSRGSSAIVSFLPSNKNICRSCRHVLLRRNYASAAAAQATIEPLASQHTSPTPPQSALALEPKVIVKAGVVLSRAPLITPDPHPFETAYYLYQRRLNERLVLPFTQYFYYKRGTPAFEHWRTKRRERGGAATRDIGKYNAYTEDGWNDETIIGDQSGQPQYILEKLVDEEGRASEFVGESGKIKTAGLKRKTAADSNNDQKSLERSLSRTLYLLVKNKKDKDIPEELMWSFPFGHLEKKEGLREAAQRILGSSCGVNMNTWFVGNHPVGHYVVSTSTLPSSTSQEKPEVKEDVTIPESSPIEKTFFMKARIMAGQANPDSDTTQVEDFRWLAKEEIKNLVHPSYWVKIKNMLVAQ